jgi:hypothetical protein
MTGGRQGAAATAVCLSPCGNFGLVGSASGRLDRCVRPQECVCVFLCVLGIVFEFEKELCVCYCFKGHGC